MKLAVLSERARRHFLPTLRLLLEGETFVRCPRCGGTRQIEICARSATLCHAARFEQLRCPCCNGTGEASADKAWEWMQTWDWLEERYGAGAAA